MKFYRLTRLRYISNILNSILSSFRDSKTIEYAFNCRHLLEVVATFDDGISKYIELSNPILNTKIEFKSDELRDKINIGKDLLDTNGFFYRKCLLPLFTEQNRIVMPTRISWKNLREKNFSNNSNNSLEPKKNDQEFVLTPESVIKACRIFEKKINNFHPTYELLSEFIHPNSYVSICFIKEENSDQFEHSTLSDHTINDLHFWEMFIKNNINKTLENVILEIINSDNIFSDHILSYNKHVKKIVKNTLGLRNLGSYLTNDIKNYRCLCDSGKFIQYCCLKTSERDYKKLKQI